MSIVSKSPIKITASLIVSIKISTSEAFPLKGLGLLKFGSLPEPVAGATAMVSRGGGRGGGRGGFGGESAGEAVVGVKLVHVRGRLGGAGRQGEIIGRRYAGRGGNGDVVLLVVDVDDFRGLLGRRGGRCRRRRLGKERREACLTFDESSLSLLGRRSKYARWKTGNGMYVFFVCRGGDLHATTRSDWSALCIGLCF